MIEIIPAIIPGSFDDLKEKVSKIVGLVPFAHMDVSDGIFDPNKTWPLVNDSGEFLKISSEVEGMPFWDSIDYEIHMMIANPEEEVSRWIRAGARRIIFHHESVNDPDFLIHHIKDNGVECGVAIKLETPESDIYPHIGGVDFVQLMSIEKVGFQGAELSDKVLDKIKNIRDSYPDAIISVDGGVKLDNAESLISAGVNRLVVGSAIWKSDSVERALEEFQNLV